MAYEPFRLRKRINKAHFSALPQPSKAPAVAVAIEDDYLKGLERFIDSVSEFLLDIQNEEIARTDQFTRELKTIREKNISEANKIDEAEQAKKVFIRDITNIRDRRKQYREILYDALQDRQGLWDAAKMQKDDEVLVQRKLQDLAILPVKQQTKVTLSRSYQDFGIFIYMIFQILFIIGYALLTKYDDSPSPLRILGTPHRISNYFTFFIFMLMMVFLGMTFLQAYLRKFAFGATLGQVLIGAFAFQWSLFVFAFFEQVYNVTAASDLIPGIPNTWQSIIFGIDNLIFATYGAGATLIAIESTLGKVKPLEHFVVAFLFVPTMGVNYYIGYWLLGAVDTGFSIFVFTFAGFWAMAFCITRIPKPQPANKGAPKEDLLPVLPKDLENNDSSYNSDIFSTIGALIIFVTFPAWNCAFAPDGTQYRVVVNTFFSELGASIFAFLVSRTFRGGKFRVGDIRSGMVAGGVVMASLTSWLVSPGGALVTGAVAGSFSVMLYANIGAAAYRIIAYDDTVGVHALYAIPGLIGALAGIISAAVGVQNGQLIYGQTVQELLPIRGVHQAGWNAIATLISIGIAVIVGGLLGVLLRLFPEEEVYYSDDTQWIVPADFDRDPKPTKLAKELNKQQPLNPPNNTNNNSSNPAPIN